MDARGDETKLRDFNTLTFDVVGTLIDFETGILDWFRPMLGRHEVSKTDEEILTTFAAVEDGYQRETAEKPFTEMLPLIYRDMASGWGIGPRDEDAESFRDSIRSWPPFPDTVGALEELGTWYRLVAVTNTDVWALERMSANMGHPFQERITCDVVGVNKPSPKVFEYVLDKLAPASALGFATMWIERRHGKGGFGATPRPEKLATPTFHAASMADFVRQAREERLPFSVFALIHRSS